MRWKTFGLAAALWVMSSMPAYAYIDPGTGSILAQAAIGIIVAAGVFARSWWSRLLTFLRLSKPRRSAESAGRD